VFFERLGQKQKIGLLRASTSPVEVMISDFIFECTFADRNTVAGFQGLSSRTPLYFLRGQLPLKGNPVDSFDGAAFSAAISSRWFWQKPNHRWQQQFLSAPDSVSLYYWYYL
jgi:hypothetical protein